MIGTSPRQLPTKSSTSNERNVLHIQEYEHHITLIFPTRIKTERDSKPHSRSHSKFLSSSLPALCLVLPKSKHFCFSYYPQLYVREDWIHLNLALQPNTYRIRPRDHILNLAQIRRLLPASFFCATQLNSRHCFSSLHLTPTVQHQEERWYSTDHFLFSFCQHTSSAASLPFLLASSGALQ